MAQKRRVFRTDRELLLQLQLVHRADHALVPLDRRRVRLAHLRHTFTQRSRIRCKCSGNKTLQCGVCRLFRTCAAVSAYGLPPAAARRRGRSGAGWSRP